MFELVDEPVVQGARIKVVGAGGAGGNAINTMMDRWIASGGGSPSASPPDKIDFIAANTDLQALKVNRATVKLQLGAELTRGLGAGADPEVGRKAAIESEAEITRFLEGADMIFITAGMGGGTGTGAAPVIARIAKDLGALTIGVVTKPFHFEGKRRSRHADQGIESLKESVDSLITIPNERLLIVAGKETSMVQAFKMADEVLLHAVRGISDLILVEGLINLDFADIRAVMSEKGMALMGSGVASGEHRAIEAATRAISSPLLEHVSIRGATGILLNVTGGKDFTLFEVNEAAKLIQEEAHPDANILFGAVIDDAMDKQVRVTVIATGFENEVRKVTEFKPYQNQTPKVSEHRPERIHSGWPSGANGEANSTTDGGIGGRAACPPIGRVSPPDGDRPRIPVHSDLKRLLVELKGQSFAAQESDADEYDVPTFLRKHAD